MDFPLYDESELISKAYLTHGETSKVLADNLDGDKDMFYEIVSMVEVHVTTGWAFLTAKVIDTIDLVDTWYTYSGHRGDIGDHYAQGGGGWDGLCLAGIKSADGFVNARSIIYAKTGQNRQALSRASWTQNSSIVMYWHHISSILKETSTKITKLTMQTEGGSGIHFAGGHVSLYRLR